MSVHIQIARPFPYSILVSSPWFNEETVGPQRNLWANSSESSPPAKDALGCEDPASHCSGTPSAMVHSVRKEIKSQNLLQRLPTSNCFYFLIPRSPSLELTCQKAGGITLIYHAEPMRLKLEGWGGGVLGGKSTLG